MFCFGSLWGRGRRTGHLSSMGMCGRSNLRCVENEKRMRGDMHLDGFSLGKGGIRIDEDFAVTQPHGMAPMTAGIADAGNPAAQFERTRLGGNRIAAAGKAGGFGTKTQLHRPAGKRTARQCRDRRGIERTFRQFNLRAVDPRLHGQNIFRAHERGNEQRCGLVVDVLWRSLLLDASSIHDNDTVSHHHGFLAIMRDVNGGDAKPLLQRADLVAYRQADAGIEVGKRLIQQQNFRIDSQRPAERHALALPAGKLSRLAGAKTAKAKQVLHLVDARVDDILGALLQLQPIADILGNGHVRP